MNEKEAIEYLKNSKWTAQQVYDYMRKSELEVKPRMPNCEVCRFALIPAYFVPCSTCLGGRGDLNHFEPAGD